MNITKTAKSYIDQHLSIKDCLKKGLINYSALAREISKKVGIRDSNFDAVLVASRRYAEQLVFKDQERDILALLKKSKLKVRTKVCRVVLHPHTHLSDHIVPLHFIQGDSGITLIIEYEDYNEVKQLYGHNILDTKRELSELIIKSPKKADEVIGLVSYLSSMLAANGINVITYLGSYTDDILIIEDKDVAKAMELLSRLLKN